MGQTGKLRSRRGNLCLVLWQVLNLLLLKNTEFNWAHELTNSKRKAWHLSSIFCIFLCSKPFSMRSLCSNLGFQERQMITFSWQDTEITLNSRSSSGWTTCHLTINPDNNSGTFPRIRTDNSQPGHTCNWDYLTMHTFCPLSPILCLFKPVCTLKTTEDELSAYCAFSQGIFRAV
jgi:hypothetical protein